MTGQTGQLEQAAYALDRYGLKQRGWSNVEIEKAIASARSPSDVSLDQARVVLAAIGKLN